MKIPPQYYEVCPKCKARMTDYEDDSTYGYKYRVKCNKCGQYVNMNEFEEIPQGKQPDIYKIRGCWNIKFN